MSVTGVTNSGCGQWYAFRGGRFHTGWMDSDCDFVDDLTECCYYGSDPFTYNPNFIPPIESQNFQLKSISLIYVPIILMLRLLVTKISKMKKTIHSI